PRERASGATPARRAARRRARPLRSGLAIHAGGPPLRGAHATGLRMAAPHRHPHARAAGAPAGLARPRADAEGIARARLRRIARLAGHGLVDPRAHRAGAALGRTGALMSRLHTVVRVDVFADRPFAGNPASAILDAEGLSEADMQAIAAEMKTAGT